LFFQYSFVVLLSIPARNEIAVGKLDFAGIGGTISTSVNPAISDIAS
jgi:hypothetical protein